jgi:hypothetical protein
MTEETQYDVFLSHSSADKESVEIIARRLRDEAGLQPWLDKWHLVPGTPWQEALEEALSQSQTCAVFIGPGGFGAWHQEEMRVALDARVRDPDFRVIPVLLPGADLPERGGLPPFLTRHTWVDFRPGLDDPHAFHNLTSGIKGIAPIEGEMPTEEAVCPYLGLRPFQEEHARFFFGRDTLIQWLVEDVRQGNFLAIIGPSGCGKSSLAQAGLIPALRQGALPGSDRWPICILMPGAEPVTALSSQLLPLLNPPDPIAARRSLAEGLRADPRELSRVVGQILAPHASAGSGQTRLLLLVDQFEELFTLCYDEAERAAFIAALLDATGPDRRGLVGVLTIRADFYGQAATHYDLAARLERRQRVVSPLDATDLRQAIEEPARLAGLHFEKGLVDTILDDAGREPGVLPLVQHTLWELWQRRRSQWLTFDAYRAIGGVQGALAHRAEEIYEGFTPEEREVSRRVILRLTQPGEGTEDTRRRATLAELLPTEGHATDVEAIVRELADARLLTTGKSERGDEIVDVSHEALIRGWPRLRNWVDEDRAALRIHRRLTEAANEWAQHSRDESYLYRGARLAEAEKWAETHAHDMNPLEREFLEASVNLRKAERRAHRRRLALRGALVGLALLLLASVGIAIRQFQRSRSPWQPVADFPSDPVFTLTATDELSPTYYIGTANIGVGRSNDGVNWTIYRQGLPTGEPAGGDPWKIVRGVGPLAIDRLNPERVFAAVLENGIYRSEYKAETWEAANTGLPIGPSESAVDLAVQGDLVLAVFNRAAGRSLYASLDGGTTWGLVGGRGTPPLDKAYAVEIAPGDDKVYVGAENGLYSSAIGPPWEWKPLLSLAPVAIITPGAGDDNGFYLATHNPQGMGDIYRWQPGETEQWLATIESHPIALAPPADPNAAVAVYVLLLNGEVQAVMGDGQISPLGQEPGLTYNLLAVSHPANEGTRLLLGHEEGLLEYQDDLEQLESR